MTVSCMFRWKNNLPSNSGNEKYKFYFIIKRRINHTMRSKYITNTILVSGVFLSFPMMANAGSIGWPVTFKVGLGKASFDTDLNTQQHSLPKVIQSIAINRLILMKTQIASVLPWG